MWAFTPLFASRPDVAAFLLALAFGVARTGAGMAQRAALAEQFETQRAGNRRRLDEPHLDAVAEPVRFAGPAADHCVVRFIEPEILVAKRGDRDETVGAGLEQPHEQTGARDAGNARV